MSRIPNILNRDFNVFDLVQYDILDKHKSEIVDKYREYKEEKKF